MKIITDKHTEKEQAAIDAGGTPRVLALPHYEGRPTVTINAVTHEYDPAGKTGPQLLGDDIGHPRQAESDANWPGGKHMKRLARKEKALERLEALDRKSIRGMREWMASQGTATPELKGLENEAVTERKFIK